LKVYRIYFLFFILSALLIISALVASGKVKIFKQQPVEVKKIQKIYQKKYLRKRKNLINLKSLENAQKEIAKLLIDSPLKFNNNSSSIEMNSTNPNMPNPRKVVLNKILMVLNHLEEDAILVIETHTDAEGSQQHNLKLSQERASVLKDYFRTKCRLPLIVAIGYGEEIPLPKKSKRSNRRVEIHLKRIQ